MAVKDDLVVDLVEEEEEEEWPEVGVQNIEEAERYTDKINNVFDHLSVLIFKIQKQHYYKPSKILRRSSHDNGKAWGRLIQM